MKKNITNIIAAFLLIIMFFIAFFSQLDDSLTMDEKAHIPAGYSYISQQDMRLNPEHPPLLKDLAGFSALIGSKITNQPINFPSNLDSWQKQVNGQWDFGNDFLFNSGNNADSIILWSRLPMILLGLCLGFFIFKWARQLYGNKAGLLALLLFCFSSTFLAHTRYVTTDVGAAAAFFIATYYLIKWLKQPAKKNLIIAGIVYGLAMLTKFSLVLLIPYFIFLTIIYSIANAKSDYFKILVKNLLLLFIIGLICLMLIWPVYQYHVLNYPAEKQFSDTSYHFKDLNNKPGIGILTNSITWMSDKPILRPYAQYMLGFIMVFRRAAGGNTNFFLGEVSNQAWWNYFPTVYFLKESLAFHLLTIIALLYALYKIKQPFRKKLFSRICLWISNHFTEFAMISFLVLYWTVSIRSNLNIGVRHILPTFPFIYVLISGQIIAWLKFSKTYFKYLIIIILLLWYVLAAVLIYPYYLAYFNEYVGGAKNGYKYVTDSNLDWGQDLKRLADWVEKNNVSSIYLAYFGGASPEYYLNGKLKPWAWWQDHKPLDLQQGDFLAISATLLQEGRGQAKPGYTGSTDHYKWLDDQPLIATIGYSIFIYQIK